ncbi:hypothetical protein GJ496_004860 [Pomphorhynchus laevis]|nr:hypothetical protein GJ496_004860 [Pomphorhynchus laevis]
MVFCHFFLYPFIRAGTAIAINFGMFLSIPKFGMLKNSLTLRYTIVARYIYSSCEERIVSRTKFIGKDKHTS